MTQLDWPGLLRLGLGRLGLAPDAFWNLTPAEFYLMLGPDPGQAPMPRDRLRGLMAEFPDVVGPPAADRCSRGDSNGGQQ